jgi:hypothetical protein
VRPTVYGYNVQWIQNSGCNITKFGFAGVLKSIL